MAGPVFVVGRGFTQVIESCPDKFADAPRIVFVLDKVVFGQVRPAAMFHVVRGALLVRIFGHGFAFDGEFVYSAGADGGSGFTTQYEVLGEFGIGFRIGMGTVVETRYVHDCCKVVVYDGVGLVHALGDGAGRVFTMADVLQEPGYMCFSLGSLFRYFIADAPHYDTRIVAVVSDQVNQVFFRPFVKNQVVAVFAFGDFPLVKRFRHDHESHFVTQVYQFGRGHVVGSTDRVAAHVFQDVQLAAQGGFVDGGTQRAQVVVHAYSLKLCPFAVQVEAFLRNDFNGADAEPGGIFVF